MTIYDVYTYVEDGRFDLHRGVDTNATFRNAAIGMFKDIPNADVRPLIIIETYVN